MRTFVTHLEGAIDGATLNAQELQTMSSERPLWTRYDLDSVRKSLTKESLTKRECTMWRYRELLPPSGDDEIVTLGEGMTPIYNCPRLADHFGLKNVSIKDDSQLPTGSFKSRGMAMALTMAKKFGVKRVAVPTCGNAGGAAAAYAARAGIEAYIFMPDDTPKINQYECNLFGAKLFLVNGLISDCGKIVRDGKEPMGWFDLSTLKEPYRLEGKKTMGLELAEQMNWTLPDVIIYPTGGGTGLIGMWKAFHELIELGWIDPDRLPRMVSAQSTGCCPIVRAFEAHEKFAKPFEDANTMASGIRVPVAVGDFMILDAIYSSNGTAVAAEEDRFPAWMRLVARLEGVGMCPEATAGIGALEQLSKSGWIKPDERVLLFNTGAAQKYPHIEPRDPARVNKDKPIDWGFIESQSV
ncbi:MAG: threonine synthase [candidate division Zixibacteria bacterium]|nr:threonine synthase [candidate division Zixibacteria bacterium]